MSFRTRLFLAFAFAVVLPLCALALGVRGEMERRLGEEYARRVSGTLESLRGEIAREGAGAAERLAALASDLESDNRFRLAMVRNDPAAHRELLDWAGAAMHLSGLSLLELQDSSGRILSSGHFRNEYGRMRPETPRLLAAAGRTPMLLRARTAEGSILALARLDSFALSGRRFALVGGVPADRLLRPAAGDPDLSLRLALPTESPAAATTGQAMGDLALPFLDAAGGAASPDTARLVVVQSGATLAAVRRSLDRWFLAALGLSTALGLGTAAWLSARVSRPLRELAAQTEAIDLDRLDHEFRSDRHDEIGALSRVLGAMTARLRAGAARLREAERRVAMGDLARQVNHDIKNGLAPIRNVLHHFDEVARDHPAGLAEVYGERRGTLESSVAYLDTLARNYARLTPAVGREPCDVNAVVGEVVRAIPAGRSAVRAETAADLQSIPTDRVALRRIVENLVGNAVDSVAAAGGSVVVSTGSVGRGGSPGVRITVADTGPGMTRTQLDQAFDDFYTTKDGGTGLGLSIVRRLVLDLGGALRVDTAPGEGTRVTVELPAGVGGERG
ncbi:MAG: HAMP domain-containing histidine kinase [Gemmatimonadales bacterium]|nr:HAMP domain-containing histidine kinase [Gemmatimonadales bacterium]